MKNRYKTPEKQRPRMICPGAPKKINGGKMCFFRGQQKNIIEMLPKKDIININKNNVNKND